MVQFTSKSLKEFYWMMSATVTFVSLLAGCYEYVAHSRLSSLAHICVAIAVCLWAVASSPSSTIHSIHQFATGGVTGSRFHPSSSWRCPHGRPLHSCKPSRCCNRCSKTLDPNSPAVVGFKAHRQRSKMRAREHKAELSKRDAMPYWRPSCRPTLRLLTMTPSAGIHPHPRASNASFHRSPA